MFFPSLGVLVTPTLGVHQESTSIPFHSGQSTVDNTHLLLNHTQSRYTSVWYKEFHVCYLQILLVDKGETSLPPGFLETWLPPGRTINESTHSSPSPVYCVSSHRTLPSPPTNQVFHLSCSERFRFDHCSSSADSNDLSGCSTH